MSRLKKMLFGETPYVKVEDKNRFYYMLQQMQANRWKITGIVLFLFFFIIFGINMAVMFNIEIAENAKNEAENNLDLIQKKTQFELINNIVKVALYVIIGVGGITTGIYVYSMSIGMDTDIIGSTWSNMFGILLTNSFSIVGTILGVKYGTSPNKDEK